MQRTYSRKRNQRRSLPFEGPQDEPSSPESTPARVRKRQKIEVEVVIPDEPLGCNGHGSEAEGFQDGQTYRTSTPSTRARAPTPPVEESLSPVTPSRPPPRSATTDVAKESRTPPFPSPRHPVRDISGVFSEATETTTPGLSRSASKPQTSITRRMLGRSRTESSVISISSTSDQSSFEPVSVYGTPKKLRGFVSDSLVGSPSSHSQQSPSKANQPDNISSPPIRPSMANSNMRTYAGKSRSFLVALPPSQAASMGMDPMLAGDTSAMLMESQEDDFETRESYSELRQRWGVDASEDDPIPVFPQGSPSPKRQGKGKGLPKETEPARLLPNGMINDLKSITELRSKGERRRFLDEVGYLFEGLDANGALGVRRGSAMEIVTKLCDADFVRRAKAADFLGRAWEVLRDAGAGDGDRVLDSILSLYSALIARDPTDLLDLAAKSDFASTLHRMLSSLEHSNDPLWLISLNAGVGELKAAGIPKAEIALLGNLQRLARKRASIFDECDLISNRLLISHALVVVNPSTHTISHLSPLLRSLTSEIGLFPSRLAAYTSGLSLFPPRGHASYMDTPSMLHLDNCLRLLDSCLLGSWSLSGEEKAATQTEALDRRREEGFPRELMALCVSCSIILQDDSLEEYRATATKCVESALRVLINLTHDDIPWCQVVLGEDNSISTIMRLLVMAQRQRQMLEKRLDANEADSDDVDNGARCLDRLCLALGLLTNLVQVTCNARHAIRDTLLDLNCPGQRRCLRGCTCPSRTNAIACLAQVYTHYLKSSNELDAVVRGHMAILFGLLMQHAPANQRALLTALPGTDDQTKLGTVLKHAQDFTLFYVALTRKMVEAQTGEENGEEEEESTYLSASAPVFRDSKGEEVAKGVIAFLKTLRNEGVR